MSKIKLTQNGFEWYIPLEPIADNRAKYYAELDKNTTYQEEYDFTMNDTWEATDWFFNNMDFIDVEEHIVLVKSPEPLKWPDSSYEYDYKVIE